MNIIASNGFVLGLNEPTRVTHSISTCLDHSIYRNVPNCETEVLLHQSFSDHYPIQLSWRVRAKTNKDLLLFRNTEFAKDSEKVKRYLYKLDKELALRKEKITTCTNPSNAFNAFSSVFLDVTDRFASLIQLGGEKQKLPKWFSNKQKISKIRRTLLIVIGREAMIIVG